MTVENLFMLTRILHIVCGGIALFVGPGAMLTRKGGNWHRLWGKIYVFAMGMVALTAIGMAFYHPNSFLGMVAIFSFYLAFSGWRLLKRRNEGEKPSPVDYIAPITAMLGSVGLIVSGSVTLFQREIFGLVALVFAVVGFALALSELRDISRPPTDKRQRIIAHIARMGGAYIATVTAFVVVNVHFLPPVLVWLLPTVIGSFLINVAIRKYRGRTGAPITKQPVVPSIPL